MELMDAIEKRRTVRDYLDKPIPAEVIEKALKAGLKAPSYNHLKQVYFTLVKDPALRLALTQTEDMKETVSEQTQQNLQSYEEIAREMYLDAIPKQKRMILKAPEVLVVAYKPKTQVADSRRIVDLNCLAAVWCCIENILLSLAEDDIYGTTMVPSNTPAVKQVLNIPQELEVATFITLGYKAPEAKIIPQKAVDLSAILFTDRWEQRGEGKDDHPEYL